MKDSLRRFWNGAGERTPWIRRIVAVIFAFLVPIPILLILLFRFLPVPGTPQMLIDLATGDEVRYRWVEYDRISPFLGRAVIGAEDQKFCSHNGFDWDSIDRAWKAHERGRRLRGASTISQQAARSLFLLPIRSWVRKGIEAYLTVLIEALWPKKRILTAYLNLVDWGHGNFGAEAASETYFHKSAAAITSYEAARLVAVLPDPDEWHAVHPGPYVASRTDTLMFHTAEVSRDRLDFCVRQ
jgi:monofunctional biosynthetic peptidoglycan transglycosylase